MNDYLAKIRAKYGVCYVWKAGTKFSVENFDDYSEAMVKGESASPPFESNAIINNEHIRTKKRPGNEASSSKSAKKPRTDKLEDLMAEFRQNVTKIFEEEASANEEKLKQWNTVADKMKAENSDLSSFKASLEAENARLQEEIVSLTVKLEEGLKQPVCMGCGEKVGFPVLCNNVCLS